jgi:hypothetical protein
MESSVSIVDQNTLVARYLMHYQTSQLRDSGEILIEGKNLCPILESYRGDYCVYSGDHGTFGAGEPKDLRGLLIGFSALGFEDGPAGKMFFDYFDVASEALQNLCQN